jgi:hypothetical protein
MCICPSVIVAMTSGWQDKTGVCLDCVLDTARTKQYTEEAVRTVKQ